ncbi:hypothetical protein PDJAM_G00116710 [Pangasius djambal]|uniref:Uncharacterized protein n=1 Tax=Pangasius djambal TaxID=1691987 RepID=A0ACC5Z857_9TELE|nr:hypothetical protein [Pangasius djambal]
MRITRLKQRMRTAPLNKVRADAVSQSFCSAEAPRGTCWLHGNAAREPYFRPHFRLRGHVVTHQHGRYDQPAAEGIG